MAYTGQFLSFNWLFTIEGTDEIATTGLDFATEDPWIAAASALDQLEDTTLEALTDEYITMVNTSDVWWADYSLLQGIKVAAIGTDGHYLTDPRIVDLGSGTDGTAAGVVPQTTMVLSLRSGSSLGTGNYGRMYLPHCGMALVSGGPYAASTGVTGLANAAQTFLQDITAAINVDLTAVVRPRIMSQAGSGSQKVIERVAVGRVIDTQRRRRNRLTEEYVTEDITYA